jgi:hypothetical protein
VIVNDVSDRIIDEALIGNFFVFITVQNKTTIPENLRDLTSLRSKPDPIPDSVPFALILPPQTDRVSITDRVPASPM